MSADQVHQAHEGEVDPVAEWRRAARNPQIEQALRELHLEIAESTRAARPLCIASGHCCRFDAFGHSLYLTGLEAAWVLEQLHAQLGRSLAQQEVQRAIEQGRCPFLQDGLCTVHPIRPFGCRTFFCDPQARRWQEDLHERCHSVLRALHDRLAIPYRYAEWRSLLAQLTDPDERPSG